MPPHGDANNAGAFAFAAAAAAAAAAADDDDDDDDAAALQAEVEDMLIDDPDNEDLLEMLAQCSAAIAAWKARTGK
jgi:hypothetical protein